MSFGAGLGSGVGFGIGSGIAVGIRSGGKRVRDAIEGRLRHFAETHAIAIRDERGREVAFDDFLQEVLGPREETDRRRAPPAAVIALLVLALLTAGLLILNILIG